MPNQSRRVGFVKQSPSRALGLEKQGPKPVPKRNQNGDLWARPRSCGHSQCGLACNAQSARNGIGASRAPLWGGRSTTRRISDTPIFVPRQKGMAPSVPSAISICSRRFYASSLSAEIIHSFYDKTFSTFYDHLSRGSFGATHISIFRALGPIRETTGWRHSGAPSVTKAYLGLKVGGQNKQLMVTVGPKAETCLPLRQVHFRFHPFFSIRKVYNKLVCKFPAL